MVCSFASFAQDIQLETKDGQVIENGSTVIVRSEMIDMMVWGQLNAEVYARNLTEKNLPLAVTMKAVHGKAQICWGGACVTVQEGNGYTTKAGIASANSLSDLRIETMVTDKGYMETMVSCTVEIIVYTGTKLYNEGDSAGMLKDPKEQAKATVTFTNDPALSIEEVKETSAKVYAKDNVLYCQFADAANRQLQVYNVAGNLCKDIRLTSESESLSLEGIAKGLYIYRVMEAGKKAESGKFLVK